MDSSRFDALTRSLAAAGSRRGLLKGAVGALLGGALASVSHGGAEAARKRTTGQICRKNGDCASGVCGPKDSYGRRHCEDGCYTASDCPQSATNDACRAVACIAGACSITVNIGAKCDDGNACTVNDICQANGSCAGTPVVCTAQDQCHEAGVCDPQTGMCSNPAKPNGSPCDDGNSQPICTADVCVDGVCTGGVDVVCPLGDICNLQTGACTCSVGQCGADDYLYCGGSNGCVCVRTPEGDPICLELSSALCADLTVCTATSDCPSGQYCGLGSCCDNDFTYGICGLPCGSNG